MTIDAFIRAIELAGPRLPAPVVAAFEAGIGAALPEDYRRFLIECNGGYVGGDLWFTGPTPSGGPADAGVHEIGRLRAETHFSLEWKRSIYAGRIPAALLWIMSDPFGNAICLGIHGHTRGRVYFWDHEREPDPRRWNGEVETARNVTLIANSFTAFVAGLHPNAA